MKQFMNSRESLITEAIDGLLRTGAGKLARLDGYPHIRVVIRTDWDRQKVALVSGGGSGHEPSHAGFVDKAPVVIAVCYNMKKGRRFKEDSSIAAEHIHLEAVNQGLASCFVQVADAGDPAGSAEPFVKELLRIPEDFRVMCMMPLGYAARELREHGDSEYDQAKVHNERF